MAKFISLFSVLALTLAIFTTTAQAGFYGVLCPPKAAAKENLTSSCEENCRTEHNALYGYCGTEHNDFNCYCTQPLAKPSPNPVHCIEKNRKYEKMCEIDCLCNHGATGHECDYENQFCKCTGQNLRPETNDLCPYFCLHDMLRDFNAFKLPKVHYKIPRKCNLDKIPIADLP